MPNQYDADNRMISERVGHEFVIALAANPTTGYQWEAEFDHFLLALLDRTFEAAGAGVGSGGTERFRFSALAPGAGDFRMIYRRHWETAPAQELVFQVRVSG